VARSPFHGATQCCRIPQREAAGMVSGTSANDHGIVELISMWVAPFARRQGVGDSLVATAIGWAQGGVTPTFVSPAAIWAGESVGAHEGAPFSLARRRRNELIAHYSEFRGYCRLKICAAESRWKRRSLLKRVVSSKPLNSATTEILLTGSRFQAQMAAHSAHVGSTPMRAALSHVDWPKCFGNRTCAGESLPGQTDA